MFDLTFKEYAEFLKTLGYNVQRVFVYDSTKTERNPNGYLKKVEINSKPQSSEYSVYVYFRANTRYGSVLRCLLINTKNRIRCDVCSMFGGTDGPEFVIEDSQITNEFLTWLKENYSIIYKAVKTKSLNNQVEDIDRQIAELTQKRAQMVEEIQAIKREV